LTAPRITVSGIDRDALPGDGFFTLANERGRVFADSNDFHQAGLAEVHAEYREA